METEEQLLNAIRSGDQLAFRRLYDRYSGYAMAIALRYIPERSEVNDVLQDSFIKILTSIGQFSYRGEGSLRNWIARIVAHQAIDYIRRRERISFVNISSEEVADDDADMGEMPSEILMEMIGRLPVHYRVVLNLFVFEQLTHKEIAQLLGIRERTSSSLFYRAKHQLKKMIKDYLDHQTI